jgi:hypothetical protein
MEPQQFNELLSVLSKNKKVTLNTNENKVINITDPVITQPQIQPQIQIQTQPQIQPQTQPQIQPQIQTQTQIQTQIQPQTQVIDPVIDPTAIVNGYYTLFGFELSKTTLIIAGIFLLLLVLYFVYRAWYGSKNDKIKIKTKPKNKLVSYEEQENNQNKDDQEDDQEENTEDTDNNEPQASN